MEGVCYHLRWMLECQDKQVKTARTIRFGGGGALSDVTSRILSDITGRTVEVVGSPQNVGSVGAAAVAAVGLGLMQDINEIGAFIPVKKRFRPDRKNKAVYDRNYEVFRKLYKCNKELFGKLNS